jgi:nucleolar protein 16
MYSYAALGLLPSIPLPNGASSSRTHRAALSLPSKKSQPQAQSEEVAPKVSYGRIIRDDAGNVVDIILDEEDEEAEGEDEGREALNPEEEYVPAPVEAKTDVVRCEFFHLRALALAQNYYLMLPCG